MFKREAETQKLLYSNSVILKLLWCGGMLKQSNVFKCIFMNQRTKFNS